MQVFDLDSGRQDRFWFGVDFQIGVMKWRSLIADWFQIIYLDGGFQGYAALVNRWGVS